MRKTRVFKLIANVCRLILACTFILSGFTKVIDKENMRHEIFDFIDSFGK